MSNDHQSISNNVAAQGEDKSCDKKLKQKGKDKKFSEIEEKLSSEKEKNKELSDNYLRLKAEFENFKKRMERDKGEFFKYALEKLIKDILPVLDHMELAIKSADESKDFDSFSEGVRLIYKQLKEILCKEGLSNVCSIGEKFDPCKHEAVMHVESEKHEPNVVMEEIKKGYILNDRLIRPAMVTVAKKPEKHKD